jgi:hypothetical protein
MERLTQWECEVSIDDFTIKALPNYGIEQDAKKNSAHLMPAVTRYYRTSWD